MTHMKFFCTFINLTTKQVSSPILVVGVANLLLLLYPSLTVSLLLSIVALFLFNSFYISVTFRFEKVFLIDQTFGAFIWSMNQDIMIQYIDQ